MACKMASHPEDAALKMLPELALRLGLRADDFEIELCSDPHPKMLQDMLVQRRWAAVFGFVNTLKAAAIEANINADQALSFIEYRHVLPELYGLGVMVSSSFEQAHPQAVVGLVKAVNRGLRACIDDPEAALQAVHRRDPTIDLAANRSRLMGTLALEMAHPESATQGIGSMDPARLVQSIQLIASAKQCSFRPKPEKIYTDQYLPQASSRIYDLARPMQTS